jgi:hypothetical protein
MDGRTVLVAMIKIARENEQHNLFARNRADEFSRHIHKNEGWVGQTGSSKAYGSFSTYEYHTLTIQ